MADSELQAKKAEYGQVVLDIDRDSQAFKNAKNHLMEDVSACLQAMNDFKGAVNADPVRAVLDPGTALNRVDKDTLRQRGEAVRNLENGIRKLQARGETLKMEIGRIERGQG